MSGNLGIALQITAIGMGLVFAAILLLWGVIALLVRATAEAPSTAPAEPPAAKVPPVSNDRRRQRAVAAAVAVMLAQEAQRKTEFLPQPHPISPWQAALRGSRMDRGERRGRLR